MLKEVPSYSAILTVHLWSNLTFEINTEKQGVVGAPNTQHFSPSVPENLKLLFSISSIALGLDKLGA